MELSQEIVLRPRFAIALNIDSEHALDAFEATKQSQSQFVISRVEDHIFIRIPKEKQHFWSPQLHLEITRVADRSSSLKGLFGPNPTVWTFFMFIHFVLGIVFIGFGIWAYSNTILQNDYGIQLAVMAICLVVWFGLYLAGRAGKSASRKEMLAMHEFMHQIINHE